VQRLARASTLHHPLGSKIETPLLVPSFSSKGFGFAPDGAAEIRRILEVAAEYLTEAMLISAYDLWYKHLPRPDHAMTELAFVDSGGYETSDLQDLSDVFVQRVEVAKWDESILQAVLDRKSVV
jgi:hypothetical protein